MLYYVKLVQKLGVFMKEFHILVVEDTKELADELIKILRVFKYNNISLATSGEDALEIASKQRIDLVIMDVILAGKLDGVETAKHIKDTAIIFLTSLTDDYVIEKILETDGFIYLTKPFKVPELKANISIVYKRFKERAKLQEDTKELKNDRANLENKLNLVGYVESDVINLESSYIYDLKNKKLFFDSKEVELTKKESVFIDLLVQNRSKTVDFDTLKEYIWADCSTPDATVRSLVRRVRKKLNEDLVKSVVNMGYKVS